MKKLYVIVRRDLSHSQRAVQGGHALAQYLLDNPQVDWDNGTLIFLGVKNEIQLHNWYYKLLDQDIKCSQFYEPDIGNEMTAIATVSNGEPFKSLNLL